MNSSSMKSRIAVNGNVVKFNGFLVRDPVARNLPSGKLAAEITLAKGKEQNAVFVSTKLYGQAAGYAAENLRKGDLCKVSGKLERDEWKDKESGATRSRTSLIAFRATKIVASKPDLSMNDIVMSGRVCKMGDVGATSKGETATTIRIARNEEDAAGNEKPIFMDVKCYGRNAEAACQLRIGSRVRVEGRLATDKWTSKDGKTLSAMVIVAKEIGGTIPMKRHGAEQSAKDASQAATGTEDAAPATASVSDATPF